MSKKIIQLPPLIVDGEPKVLHEMTLVLFLVLYLYKWNVNSSLFSDLLIKGFYSIDTDSDNDSILLLLLLLLLLL